MFSDITKGVLEEFVSSSRSGVEFKRAKEWYGYGMLSVPYRVCPTCKKPCESSYCSDKCRNKRIAEAKRYYQSLTSEQKAKKNEAGRAKKRKRDAKYREARRIKNGTKRIAKKGCGLTKSEYSKVYRDKQKAKNAALRVCSEVAGSSPGNDRASEAK
jgi:predicted nucleic acid-binding Zn ribbon protein